VKKKQNPAHRGKKKRKSVARSNKMFKLKELMPKKSFKRAANTFRTVFKKEIHIVREW